MIRNCKVWLVNSSQLELQVGNLDGIFVHCLLPQISTPNSTGKFQSRVQIVTMILLMAEILHHLGCMKPQKQWDKLPTSTDAGFQPSTVPYTTFLRLTWPPLILSNLRSLQQHQRLHVLQDLALMGQLLTHGISLRISRRCGHGSNLLLWNNGEKVSFLDAAMDDFGQSFMKGLENWTIMDARKKVYRGHSSIFKVSQQSLSTKKKIAGWWFQPIWKILVKLDIFPK